MSNVSNLVREWWNKAGKKIMREEGFHQVK
jgi:hypothetical protein